MTPDLPPVGWAMAFFAGTVSFLSPCVMPLIPGYLSYVSGVSLHESHGAALGGSARVLGQSLLFVLGFTVVFVALGATASTIGAALAAYRPVLNRLSGVFIVAMGLSLAGALQLPMLARERRFDPGDRAPGVLRAAGVGAALAFAWIPCVGPILASILLYAGTVGTVKTGALLLLLYALGLGAPFILTGLAFTRAVRALRLVRRYSGLIERASGVALIGVGVLLLANKMFYVSVWAQQLFTRLGLNLWRFL